MLQFRNTAQRIYANLSAQDRARLDDYARGVNLFIAQSEDAGHLPIEFKLLGYRPEPWTGVDSISVGMMMVQMLDTHWPTKLARARITAKLNNPRLVADLYPVGSWRDRPPTGVTLDLSQPHAEPAVPPDEDDDEDEPSSASAVPAHDALPACVGWNQRSACKCSACPPAKDARRDQTTGWSPATTRPAASRCSRTICISA